MKEPILSREEVLGFASDAFGIDYDRLDARFEKYAALIEVAVLERSFRWQNADRQATIAEILRKLDGLIKKGPLDEPAHSERNGLVLAFNAVAQLSTEPTTPRRNDGWQPIETAPKGCSIQLWVPAIGIFIDGPWRGRWSYVANQWVLDSPLRASDGRGISISEIPNPTHWKRLPEAPINAVHAGEVQ